MKELIGTILFILVLFILMGIGDWACLKNDEDDLRRIHPTWEQWQVEAEARLIHKGHGYHGSGGGY